MVVFFLKFNAEILDVIFALDVCLDFMSRSSCVNFSVPAFCFPGHRYCNTILAQFLFFFCFLFAGETNEEGESTDGWEEEEEAEPEVQCSGFNDLHLKFHSATQS